MLGKSDYLKTAATVYRTMEVKTLSRMVPFFDFLYVERMSVDAVKHNFIAMKADHMKGAIIFGDLVATKTLDLAGYGTTTTIIIAREVVKYGILAVAFGAIPFL